MNEINKELIQQVETMRAQKDIKIEGPLNQVYAYMEAVSRIFEIAADIQDQTNKIE